MEIEIDPHLYYLKQDCSYMQNSHHHNVCDWQNNLYLLHVMLFFLLYFFSAEQEAKLKMEKVNEIKKINAQMVGIKSEISKHEDTLKEYQLYRSFLESLIPPVCDSHFTSFCSMTSWMFSKLHPSK